MPTGSSEEWFKNSLALLHPESSILSGKTLLNIDGEESERHDVGTERKEEVQ